MRSTKCICRGKNPACERCGGFFYSEEQQEQIPDPTPQKRTLSVKLSKIKCNADRFFSSYPNIAAYRDYTEKKKNTKNKSSLKRKHNKTLEPYSKFCFCCGKDHIEPFKISENGLSCLYCRKTIPVDNYLDHIKQHNLSKKVFAWYSSHFHFYLSNQNNK